MTKETNAEKLSRELEEYFERKSQNTAPAWLPEPGTTRVGTVTALRMGQDMGYGAYPIITYKGDDGVYFAVHAFHTLLRNRLSELETTIGKRQILSYDGKRRKSKATDEEIAKGLADYHFYYIENAGEENSVTGVEEGFSFN